MPHLIRLRGPWNWQRPDGSSAGEIDLKLPAARDLVAAGPLQLTRRFGRPTLPAGERVLLVIQSPHVVRAASLNATPLSVAATSPQVRVDVTDELAARNELVLDLSATASAEQLVEVWLEIGSV